MTDPLLAAAVEALRWLTEHLREWLPELAGGFIAYMLHLVYHELWKKPGHFLTRLIFRKRHHK